MYTQYKHGHVIIVYNGHNCMQLSSFNHVLEKNQQMQMNSLQSSSLVELQGKNRRKKLNNDNNDKRFLLLHKSREIVTKKTYI